MRFTVIRSLLAVIALLMTTLAGAQTVGGRPDFVEILKKADALVTFSDTDFSAVYSFTQETPGQGTTSKQAMVFRRDRENTYLIVITQPVEDRGKGYLKSGDNLWYYDPVSRRFTFTSAKDHFQNMNARNSDFTRSNLAGDYKVVSSQRAKLGIYDCWLLDLVATSNDITFPRMKVWVSDDGLVRKTQDFSYSGQLLRTVAFPQYLKIENRFYPTLVVIVDELRGAVVNGKFEKERTTYTVTRPSLQKLPDATFTKTWLEKLSE
jgi:outer membrane lipoprotein-sorting protein